MTEPFGAVEDFAEAFAKTCPDCAESVRAEANLCRYCGHSFRDDGRTPAPRDQRVLQELAGAMRKDFMLLSRIGLWLVGLFVLFIFLLSVTQGAICTLQ